MLVPMCLSRPDRAYHYALICTVASVVGGLLGYVIGASSSRPWPSPCSPPTATPTR